MKKAFCQQNNLIKENGYTAKFDAYNQEGVPYQIKTYKKGSELMMADPFRYLNNDKDFYLVVAERDGDSFSHTVRYVRNRKLQEVLNRNDFKFRSNYCQQLLNNVSNNRSDDGYFTKQMKAEKEARKSSIINVQAKRDHKQQKRVQWSIPNRHINDFLSLFDKIE